MYQLSTREIPTLQERRKTAGLSQKAVAKKCGVSLSTINYFERLKRLSDLTPAVLTFYRLKPEDFVVREGKKRLPKNYQKHLAPTVTSVDLNNLFYRVSLLSPNDRLRLSNYLLFLLTEDTRP